MSKWSPLLLVFPAAPHCSRSRRWSSRSACASLATWSAHCLALCSPRFWLRCTCRGVGHCLEVQWGQQSVCSVDADIISTCCWL